MKQNYKGGSYLAGHSVALHLNLKAGKYYKGQILAHPSNSQTYEAYNASASNGTEVPRAIFYEGDEAGIPLAAAAKKLALVSGTEYMGAGLKDSSGAALSVTDTVKQALLEHAGIIIR
ncbi:MAG: hypothetical protein AAF975_02370 [Spirochaetota bacterium]